MVTIPTELKKHLVFLFILSIILSAHTAIFQHMNNFLIFKHSFFHLFDGTSLYKLYPSEHDDLFKYSPTFALFMGFFAYLPSVLGAVLWNLLGAGLFSLALLQLPTSDSTKKAIFWISLPEFIGSTQGFQSNIHIISLLMIFWLALENKKPWLAALTLLGSFFIKIFGILGLCLFLFSNYSTKNKKFFLQFCFAFVALFFTLTFLPAAITGLHGLHFQYQEWARLLQQDASISYGFSLMGLFHGFSNITFNPLHWQIAGGLLWVLILLIYRQSPHRALGFISLCYFLVVFNHKSESPTFIIPMVAFGLHQSYFLHNRQRWAWIALTLGFVSVLYADPFRGLRPFLDGYALKVVPFVLLWPVALWQLSKKTNN